MSLRLRLVVVLFLLSVWAYRSSTVRADRFESGQRFLPNLNPDEVAEQLRPYVDAGYRHLICGFPPPYDDETMRRLATEVRPALEALV